MAYLKKVLLFCIGGEMFAYKQHQNFLNFLSLKVSYSKILKITFFILCLHFGGSCLNYLFMLALFRVLTESKLVYLIKLNGSLYLFPLNSFKEVKHLKQVKKSPDLKRRSLASSYATSAIRLDQTSEY